MSTAASSRPLHQVRPAVGAVAAADHQAEGVQIHLPAAAVRRAGHDPREGVVYLLKGDAVALQAAVAVVERAPPDPEGAGLVRREVVLREREVIYLLPGGGVEPDVLCLCHVSAS